MASNIHPTAVIDPKAELGENVDVGPYSLIAAGVRVCDGTQIQNNVTIMGPTVIGRHNRIFAYASIGQDPQDKKFHGEPESFLEIGDGNTIREYVTINRGSEFGGGHTRVGNDNWIMAYCHVAHDCQVGNKTVFANGATLAGHVNIEDGVTLGGFTAVHQYCSIGELAMTGGLTMIAQDVPPFVTASGNRVRLYGINKIGMERYGLPKEEIDAIQKAYKTFYRSRLANQEALERIENELAHSPGAQRFAKFIRESKRGICR